MYQKKVNCNYSVKQRKICVKSTNYKIMIVNNDFLIFSANVFKAYFNCFGLMLVKHVRTYS